MNSSVTEYEDNSGAPYNIYLYIYIFCILKHRVAKSMGEMERAPIFCLGDSTGMEGNLRDCSEG